MFTVIQILSVRHNKQQEAMCYSDLITIKNS